MTIFGQLAAHVAGRRRHARRVAQQRQLLRRDANRRWQKQTVQKNRVNDPTGKVEATALRTARIAIGGATQQRPEQAGGGGGQRDGVVEREVGRRRRRRCDDGQRLAEQLGAKVKQNLRLATEFYESVRDRKTRKE